MGILSGGGLCGDGDAGGRCFENTMAPQSCFFAAVLQVDASAPIYFVFDLFLTVTCSTVHSNPSTPSLHAYLVSLIRFRCEQTPVPGKPACLACEGVALRSCLGYPNRL
jgi:hypothetical protein